jgi:hypothetical protein
MGIRARWRASIFVKDSSVRKAMCLRKNASHYLGGRAL